MGAGFQVLIVSSFVQIAGSVYCAIWPLKIIGLTTPSEVFKAYTLADSNLDVCLLAFLNLFFISIIVWIASFRPRRGSLFRNTAVAQERSLLFITITAVIYQLLLLSKAVIVAIVGSDDVWPGKQGSGLAYTFASIVLGLLTSFAQDPAARSVIKNWQRENIQYEDEPIHHDGSRVNINISSNVRPSSTNGNGSTTLSTPLLRKQRYEEGASKTAMSTQQHQNEVRKATIGSLLKLSAVDAPILFLAFSAGAAAALGQALIPYYTGRIVDYASIDPDPFAFKQTTLKLLGVALACALFTGIRGGLFSICMTRLNVRLRKALFASLMRQDIGFYDSTKTGEITSRLAADTSTVSDQVSLNLNVMLRSATQAAMVLGFMFSASWRLTVVTFVMVPVVLAICKIYGNYYRKMSKKVQSELAEANAVADEGLSTMSTVKAHAAEGSTQSAYAAKLDKFYNLQKNESLAYAIYMTTNTFLSAAVVAGVLYYGGTLVLNHSMSAGALVSFMLYQQSLSGAFQQLGDVFSALSAAVGAADKVVELMHRQPAIPPFGELTPSTFTGKIELRDVNFAYPSRPGTLVLRNFSLVINPGEVVALVGSSGGGKSSIVKLVERFYLPSSGSVLIDNRDVGEYNVGWLRRHVALVSQEPVLYARSIRRNIIYGLEREDGVPEHEIPNQTDIEDAARLANAHDFICALPNGYDTEILGSSDLSGGQKQRVAIARALVRRPAILLLDEATSALDSESEQVVQEALDRTMAGRSVLVIAHRLSTVQNADRIVVVQGGQVIEIGTHDDLIERPGGAYAALVKRQITKSTSSGSLGRRTSSFLMS